MGRREGSRSCLFKKKVGHTHTHKGGVVEVEDLLALLGRERLRVGGDCLLKGQIPK